ncbi:hypothetical protein LCGC14_2018050 [marine sediment metagenome]|uniref:Uncharacterized protein n=1 Tax=marine sediment metagenome TaxID=412755 RepID=A0A0F9EYC7_9ZZZZ
MKRTMYLYKVEYQEKLCYDDGDVWLDFSKNVVAFEDAMTAVSFLLTNLKDKTIRICEVTRIACVDDVYRNILPHKE